MNAEALECAEIDARAEANRQEGSRLATRQCEAYHAEDRKREQEIETLRAAFKHHKSEAAHWRHVAALACGREHKERVMAEAVRDEIERLEAMQ